MFELKKYRGVIFHDTEGWYKIWRGIDLSFQNWQEEFDIVWLEHLGVSKIFPLMGSFWAKFVWAIGVILHDIEEWYKIWRGINLSFENWHEEFDNFDLITESLKNIHFNGLLLSKVYIVLAKKCRGVIFHDTEEWYKIRRGIDLLCVLKLRWGIWQILTWALESFKKNHFNRLFLSKVYIVWAKKVQRSYLSWHWRVIQNLETNRLVVLKLTWGIWQNFTRALESVKIGIWWDPFVQSRKFMSLKFNVWWHWRFWRKTDLCFQKWNEEFGKFA